MYVIVLTTPSNTDFTDAYLFTFISIPTFSITTPVLGFLEVPNLLIIDPWIGHGNLPFILANWPVVGLFCLFRSIFNFLSLSNAFDLSENNVFILLSYFIFSFFLSSDFSFSLFISFFFCSILFDFFSFFVSNEA